MKKKRIVKLLNCFIANECIRSRNNLTIEQFNNFNTDKGFSLIRYIIVIGVIGVLTIAIFVLFDPIAQVEKTQDSQRKSDLAQIQKHLQEYYRDFGKFPPNPGNCLQDSTNCKIVRLDATTVNWGENFNPYVKILPKDPSKNKTYIYYVRADRQAYYLYASLDKGDDPDVCNKGEPCSSLSFIGLGAVACGGICNYGVASGNVTP